MENQVKKLKQERKGYFIMASGAWIFFIIVCMQCFHWQYPLAFAIMGIIIVTPLFSHCLLLSTQIYLLDDKNIENDSKKINEEFYTALVSLIVVGLIYGYLFVESIYKPFMLPISIAVVPIVLAGSNHLLILNTLIQMYNAESEENDEKKIVNIPS